MFEKVEFVSCGKFISKGEWIHPRRIIDSYEIIFVLEGQVFIKEGNEEYLIEKNSAILLRPEVEHLGYKRSENTSFYWLHFIGCPSGFGSNIKVINNPYNVSLFFKQLLHFSSEGKDKEALSYLTRLVLFEFFENNENNTERKLLNQIKEWVKNNSDIDIKVSDVAKQFGYNADYISRLFKNNMKISLKNYIDNNRIRYIKNILLNTDDTLLEISEKCGFSDYKYFLKFFKYHEKLTPTEFCNLYSRTKINNA